MQKKKKKGESLATAKKENKNSHKRQQLQPMIMENRRNFNLQNNSSVFLCKVTLDKKNLKISHNQDRVDRQDRIGQR